MQYGICNLGIISLRLETSHKSELVSQVLYGEIFKITEKRKHWSKIKLFDDGTIGWIDNKQYQELSDTDFTKLSNTVKTYSIDLVEFVQDVNKQLIPITLGAAVHSCTHLGHHFEGNTIQGSSKKDDLISTSFMYLNTPYLNGGKTPFGIDASGFTQMVYKINGYELAREACNQANQGEVLSFIEESEPGDLAFFDNQDGEIDHVGIILKDNYIIHVDGKVCVDRLDHSGIYSETLRQHTHKLRVIKKII